MPPANGVSPSRDPYEDRWESLIPEPPDAFGSLGEEAPAEGLEPGLRLPEDFWAADERDRPEERLAAEPAPLAPGPARPPPAEGPATERPRSTRPRSTRRRAAGLIGLAGLVAAVVLVLVLGGGTDDQGTRSLEAAAAGSSRPARLAGPLATTTFPATGAPATGAPGPAGAAEAPAPSAGVAGAVGASATGADGVEEAPGPADEVDPAPDPGPRQTVSPSTTALPSTLPPAGGGLTRLPDVEHAILVLTNTDRGTNGVPAVSRDGCLDAEASAWARNMAAAGAMGHSGNGGGAVQGCRGGNAYWGDNVGRWEPCYAPAMESWWMGSASHRAHILDANFTVVGIGVWSAPDGQCFFQVYFGS